MKPSVWVVFHISH